MQERCETRVIAFIHVNPVAGNKTTEELHGLRGGGVTVKTKLQNKKYN